MKKCLSLIIFMMFICASFTVNASGLDDPVPLGSNILVADSYIYKIYLPDGEEYTSNPNSLLLNLFSNQYPSYGTKLTKAPDTNNGTQWFRRMKVTLDGTTYYMWATYNAVSYSMNCSRVDEYGSKVNVVPSINNNRGDLNIHSPRCFDPNHGTHFLAAPARSMQTSIMVVCSYGEATGYTNNTYLKWSPSSIYLEYAQVAYLYRMGGYGYDTNGCVPAIVN